MKGRHMTVVDNGVRNYVFAPQAIDSSRLNYHGVKPPLKLLALGRFSLFLFPQSLSLTNSHWTDGGGIRGLSDLLIIKEIMHRLMI